MYVLMHGDHHPDIAMAMSNMGGVYFSTGRYDQSLQCFDKALAMYKSELGEIHVAVLYDVTIAMMMMIIMMMMIMMMMMMM